MTFDLVRPITKAVFRARRKVLLIWSSLLLLLPLAWALEDLTGLSPLPLFLIIFSIPAGVLIYPLLRYGKLSQSTLTIGENDIEIRDRKGVCLKQIPFDSITEIRREQIYGELFGEKKDECHGVYLCFFLNGNTEVPDVPFHKLFLHKNFTMVYYEKENLPLFSDSLRQKLYASSNDSYYR